MTSARFLETFLSLSLQAALVVWTAMILSRLAKSDRERNRLWAASHFVLIAIIVCGFFLPHFRLLPRLTSLHGVTAQGLLSLESIIGQGVAAVWGIGASVALLRLLAGSFRAIQILRRSGTINRNHLANNSGTIAIPETAFDGINHGAIQFLTNSSLHSPCCWQIHRPIIVLPQFVLSFPPDELRLMIRHEVEHLRAGHPLQLFLQQIVGVLYWFHPAIWQAARQADKYRELTCDENSVSSREDAATFLKTLIRLAECRAVPSELTPAGLSFGGSAGFAMQRADRVSHRDWESNRNLGKPSGLLPLIQVVVAGLAMLLWLPTDITASNRSALSPWPTWSAEALRNVGVAVRDYEIDGHRLRPHKHTSHHNNAVSHSVLGN